MLEKLGHGLSQYGAAGGEGGGPSYLDSVIASACCDLDATISESYGGSGETWANLIASPADGAGQSDYDCWLGAASSTDGDEPTFNGTAGDAAAYFSVDGGDFFTIKSRAAATTLYNMHKSGTSGGQWWAAFAYRPGDAGTRSLWGGSWVASDIGAYAHFDPNGWRRLYRGTSSALDNAFSDTDPSTDYASGQDVLAIVSADMTATSNNMRIWTVSTTSVVGSYDFGNNNDTANNDFCIGATNSGSPVGLQATGTRIYHFSCGNEFLTDAKAADIFAHLEARHSRDYTP